MKVSIVVPVLNEEKTIEKTLSSINRYDEVELIVVDGGSIDRTLEIARDYTDIVVVSQKGRATQMNLGARYATGDILLFLHADCILPDNAFSLIRSTMEMDSVSAGAFDIYLDHPSFIYRVIEFGANMRSRITSIIYGDQAMFLKRGLFNSMGGFKEIPLMEDVEISQRLKRLGRVVFLRPPVKVSPRRFQKEGPFYTVLRDWYIAIQYTLFKVNPEKLKKYYRDVR
jgi:rSAM/selenodomain-associated transferase 2